jgi:hypothetical protein
MANIDSWQECNFQRPALSAQRQHRSAGSIGAGFLYKFIQNLNIVMKRSILLTLCIVLLITVSLAFTKKNDPGYKNLKILPKDITKEQMDSVMHHFTNSLNVRCGFCHVHNDSTRVTDYASDENKHKLAAREMMEMTNKINDTYFNMTGEQRNINTVLMVTCFTCHHGKNEPDTKAPPRQRPEQQLKAPWDSTIHQ